MNSHRERLLGMLDEGLLDPKTTVRWLVSWLSEDNTKPNMIEWLVSWLSEDEVEAFLDAYELSDRYEETEAEAKSRLLYHIRRNSRY